MTYRSPYSSRRYRRAQRAALWPKLAGILVVVLLCVVGVLALYKAGFTLSIVRSGGEATAPPSAVAAAPGTPAGELTPTAAAGRPGPPSAGGVVGSP
ncbi:MAG TPA: hypothetical protein VFW96_13735, partial [Thermomicrobiales bacterium]|nr:hypothetical protein [Thermomicrobiales bacterium]